MNKGLSRLETYSKELAAHFRQATRTAQRASVLASCSSAVLVMHIREQKIADALRALSSTNGASPEIITAVEDLARGFDRNYISLLEKAGGVFTADVLAMFRKARAASALHFALSATDDPSHLEESLYEAIMASQDRRGIEAIARNALGDT